MGSAIFMKKKKFEANENMRINQETKLNQRNQSLFFTPSDGRYFMGYPQICMKYKLDATTLIDRRSKTNWGFTFNDLVKCKSIAD